VHDTQNKTKLMGDFFFESHIYYALITVVLMNLWPYIQQNILC